MGYYYAKARQKKELTALQQERYGELRGSFNELHPDLATDLPSALRERLVYDKDYIGPIFNGETWSALEELVEDTLVNWVLAEENPQRVKWLDPKDLVVPEPPPTEEELEEGRKRWEDLIRRQEKRQKEDARIDFEIRFWWLPELIKRPMRKMVTGCESAP